MDPEAPMKTIHIRTKLESDTLHLPELRDLIGRSVEIIVREEVPAVRDEFYAELASSPDTDESFAARQETLRRWRADPRFAVYWPQIDYLLTRDLDHYRKWAAAHEAVRQLREEGGFDYDAVRAQREYDRAHANDHLR
jgi:hypothetical protein